MASRHTGIAMNAVFEFVYCNIINKLDAATTAFNFLVEIPNRVRLVRLVYVSSITASIKNPLNSFSRAREHTITTSSWFNTSRFAY